MIPMIKGEKADYSASLFEIKGVSIIYKRKWSVCRCFKRNLS